VHNIFNEDAIEKASERIVPGTVDLVINDPPFGIGEGKFDRHYSRDEDYVLTGYKEAPPDYAIFTHEWMKKAHEVLKPSGSMFVFIGHTNLRHVLNSAAELGLVEVNHLIWKYNFGVYTKRKFVTSHYHLLYYSKTAKRKFNTYARFAWDEKQADGSSVLYRDLEDVFIINKEYQPKTVKNKNKLPDSLIEKLILYTTDPGDIVCDFFLGNFTTALVAHSLGRIPCGFEINDLAYKLGMERLNNTIQGGRLGELKPVINNLPENQGKPFSKSEIKEICKIYNKQKSSNVVRRQIIDDLSFKFGRGKFSISNTICKHCVRS